MVSYMGVVRKTPVLLFSDISEPNGSSNSQSLAQKNSDYTVPPFVIAAQSAGWQTVAFDAKHSFEKAREIDNAANSDNSVESEKSLSAIGMADKNLSRNAATQRANTPVSVKAEFAAEDVAIVEFVPGDAQRMRRMYPNALTIAFSADFADSQDVSNDKAAQPDFVIPTTVDQFDPRFINQLISHAAQHWRKSVKVTELVTDVGKRRQRMHQLNEISLSLTAQMNQQQLLHTILSEAIRIAGCEGGSLFLVEPDPVHEQALVFKLAQNNVLDFPFVESRLPVSTESIAGYVAVTGEELNIKDVYHLANNAPYKFNRSFDDQMNYRSRSMLALPMRDHRGRVVGVLQFINRLGLRDGAIIRFGEETVEVLRAIASQAAVSLQKNALLQDISQLFESFVQASVKTIEQRDPSTSGHSFRVAETTVSLFSALPKSGSPAFRNLQLTDEDIKEVRYAALLHDFGKIGVPEAILVKANKLSDDRLSVIRYRIELQKERLRRRSIEQQLELLHHKPIDYDVSKRRIHRQLEKQLNVLDQYYDAIQNANKPDMLDAGDLSHIAEIRDYAFRELDGTVGGVISDEDVLALSVRRGSLTPSERRAIQSHVTYTKDFLSVLPWPPELAQVPDIAGAHHERLDGSGYPEGLLGEQIPLASRAMAVCDVYDALTAMDRAYKPAMSQDAAFSVLNDEARTGLLDKNLVDIFIASGSYHIADAV